jgi:quinol monooxygenase YgiN
MFGTIFRMRPKQGQEQALVQMLERWERERRPQVAGFVASYLLTSRTNPGEVVGVAVFDSEQSYQKNANDPEQDRWYRELRALLESDPEWNDGEVRSIAQ